MTETTDRRAAELLDAADQLAWLRDRFHIPDGLIYLDGNSLGALPRSTPARLTHAVRYEWGERLINSWNEAGWWTATKRVAALLTPLLGADADEVTVADSTSVNLFKLLVAGARLRQGRDVLVAERAAFPTDVYITSSAAELLGARLRLIDEKTELDAALDDRVAVVILSHVDFRTGSMWDAAATTARIHSHGALALWDLCHSTGALPVDLHGWDADLAVGCGYKYLNGGPGAPAYCFVARRHHGGLRTPLPGWFGHAQPFAMRPDYQPGPGVDQLRGGTPPVLSLLAMEQGVACFDGVDMNSLRAKGKRLTTLFAELVAEHHTELELASPSDADARGSQVCFRHPLAHQLVRALAERGVIGDFREPDIARFGLAPAYLRFTDVWDAVQRIATVLAGDELRDARLASRPAVT